MARAQQAQPQAQPPKPFGWGRGWSMSGGHPDPFPPMATHPAVALVQGDDRRKMVFDALVAVDDQIRPKLKDKKYVVIKPNNVTTTNQLGATHADAMRGMLDYLAPRFSGPVVIAESSAGDTMQGFEHFKYPALVSEFKDQRVSLVDLNAEARYVLLPLIDYDLHVVPVRLAARLLDPDAFIFCAAVLKTHNVAVATLSIKNMVLGAPLHQAPKEMPSWNDKRRYHVGIRQSLYNMFLTAQKMQPNWGAAIIDGYEGMEGNGPAMGTPVASRLAIASTDYVAADRVGVEVMGIDPSWFGVQKYCTEVGLGQWDLSKIEIRGAQIAAVQKKYRMHPDVERELRWMGPMQELPPNLGWVRPFSESGLA
jgi:uncharacterized protein (DUF362 family)